MKLIPWWVPVAVGGALLAVIGVQQLRLAERAVEIESYKTLVATREGDLKEVNRLAAEARASWAAERAALQATHAANQQKANDEFSTELQRIEAARRTADDELVRLRADNGRLRGQVHRYSAITRAEGESDTSVASRAAHRLAVVGGLLGEAVERTTREAELAAEGRSLIEQRDAEVKLLQQQIKVDREACSAPVKASAL